MSRDTQRSRVYEWEGRIRDYHRKQEFKTVHDVAAFAGPIWRAERGRYGHAKRAAPEFVPASWGQTSALAHADHRISLPLWARQTPVVLHEMAHRLAIGDQHGPRFVGVLIGLLSRHAGYVADELMAAAEEMGVKYNVRSIGSVPIRGPLWMIERALREEKPMSEMDLACWLDLSYLQVRGAAMNLIRHGKARWLRRKLVPILPEVPVVAVRKVADRSQTVAALAKRHGVNIDREGAGWSVWPPANLGDVEDPFEGDHGHDSWDSAKDAVVRYLGLLGIAVPGYGEGFVQPAGASA